VPKEDSGSLSPQDVVSHVPLSVVSTESREPVSPSFSGSRFGSGTSSHANSGSGFVGFGSTGSLSQRPFSSGPPSQLSLALSGSRFGKLDEDSGAFRSEDAVSQVPLSAVSTVSRESVLPLFGSFDDLGTSLSGSRFGSGISSNSGSRSVPV
jgi:hypothetical protein